MTMYRRTTTRPKPRVRREVWEILLLMLAILAVWYLAWGRYRDQPPPKVQYQFENSQKGRAQP